MRLNKYISAFLGGAALLGLSACTDEAEYTPAQVPAGDEVFFSNEMPTTLSILPDATSVDVPVDRLRADNEITVGVIASVTDADGNPVTDVFTLPESVTFAADASVTEYVVGYDFSKVVADKVYTLALKLEGAEVSPYGNSEVTLSLTYRAWTPLEEYSTTEYEGVMGSPWTGEPIGGRVYFSKSLLNDYEEEWVFPGPTYSNLHFAYDLFVDKRVEIEVDGLEEGKHAYRVSMPITDTNFDNEGERIYYQTAYDWVVGFLADIQGEEPTQEYIDWAFAKFELTESYYVPEDGAFHLFLVPFTMSGSLYNDSETLLQLPGFAHYEITFSVQGSFIDGGGQESFVIDAVRSSDLASYAYEVVRSALTEEQVEAQVEAIKADTEQTLYVEQNRTFLVPLEDEGTYTIVAVGYDAAGNPVYSTSFEFEAESVAKPSDWAKRGICEYTDDFVASLYNNFDNYTWEVEYEESISTPGFYRLVKPYQAFVNDINDSSFATYQDGKNYLYIHAEDPTCAYVGESLLGMVLQGDGPWIVTSQADGLISDGVSAAVVKSYGMAGTLVNGVFTMPAQSNPVNGNVYSNILMIDEANYGQGWYRANTHGKMKVDFLLDEQASAPAKAPRKATAAGAYALSRKFVPMKADYNKAALKSVAPVISKYVKVTHL